MLEDASPGRHRRAVLRPAHAVGGVVRGPRQPQRTRCAGVPVHFFVNAVGGVSITPDARHATTTASPRPPCTAGTLATAVQITATVDVNDDGSHEVVNQFTPVNIVGGPPNAGPLQPGGRVPQHRRPRHLRPRGRDHRLPQRPLRQRRRAGHGGQLHHQRRQRLQPGADRRRRPRHDDADQRGRRAGQRHRHRARHDPRRGVVRRQQRQRRARRRRAVHRCARAVHRLQRQRPLRPARAVHRHQPATAARTRASRSPTPTATAATTPTPPSASSTSTATACGTRAQSPGVWDGNALLSAAVRRSPSRPTPRVSLDPPTLHHPRRRRAAVHPVRRRPRPQSAGRRLARSPSRSTATAPSSSASRRPSPCPTPRASAPSSRASTSFTFCVVDDNQGEPTTAAEPGRQRHHRFRRQRHGRAGRQRLAPSSPPPASCCRRPTGTPAPTGDADADRDAHRRPDVDADADRHAHADVTVTPTPTATDTATRDAGTAGDRAAAGATSSPASTGAPSCDGTSHDLHHHRRPAALHAVGAQPLPEHDHGRRRRHGHRHRRLGHRRRHPHRHRRARPHHRGAGRRAAARLAAFVSVDLFVNQRSDNGDGTFTSVLGAVVTDSAGVTVAGRRAGHLQPRQPGRRRVGHQPRLHQRGGALRHRLAHRPAAARRRAVLHQVHAEPAGQDRARCGRACAPPTAASSRTSHTIVLPDNRPATPTATQPTATATRHRHRRPARRPRRSPARRRRPAPRRRRRRQPCRRPRWPFVSAQPTQIGVRASGLTEQSVLTFKRHRRTHQPGARPAGDLRAHRRSAARPSRRRPAITDAQRPGEHHAHQRHARTTSVQVIAQVDANDDGVARSLRPVDRR